MQYPTTQSQLHCARRFIHFCKKMKTFKFDELGSMTVTGKSMGVDIDGNPLEMAVQHDIQPSQLKAHLPMFAADMSSAELAEANAIIAAQ
jgi:hypothetical protein